MMVAGTEDGEYQEYQDCSDLYLGEWDYLPSFGYDELPCFVYPFIFMR
jgi:hypothetical protein